MLIQCICLNTLVLLFFLAKSSCTEYVFKTYSSKYYKTRNSVNKIRLMQTRLNGLSSNADNKTIATLFDFTSDDVLLTNICVGSKPQCFDVTIDTESQYTYLTSQRCTNKRCPSKRFDTSASTSLFDNKSNCSLFMDSKYVEGKSYTDTFFFGKMDSFKVVMPFALAEDFHPIGEGSNGALSLKRVGKSPITTLFKSVDYVTKDVFSLSWNSYWEGELRIGDYPQLIRDSNFTNYTSCKISTESIPQLEGAWSCGDLTNLYIGNNSFYQYQNPSSVLFESASKFILAPREFFDIVFDNYFKDFKNDCEVSYVTELSSKLIMCNANLKPENLTNFGLFINGVNYEIDKTNLFSENKEIFYYNKTFAFYFKVLFKDHQMYWSLGTPFLKNFITVFDNEKNEVGFVRNTQDLTKPSSGLILILIIIGAIVFIAIIIVGIYWWTCQRNKHKTSQDLRNQLIN